MGVRIDFVSVDGGAATVCGLLSECAQSEGCSVRHVNQVGYPGASQALPNQQVIAGSETEIRELLKEPPALVVAGVSGNQEDICMSYVHLAKKNGIPVVKVIDFWGTGMPHERGLVVTKVCVLDESSRVFEARMRAMAVTDIVATGAPQFDRLRAVRPIAKLVSGEGGPFVLFYGPSSEARVREILDPLVAELVQGNAPVRFGAIWHPKSNPSAYAPELERQLNAKGITLLGNDELRRVAEGDLARLSASASLVIGSTSTEILAACYLGVPTLSIVPQVRTLTAKEPAFWSNLEMIARRGVLEMPTVTVGASLQAKNRTEIGAVLSSFFQCGSDWDARASRMRDAQRAHYQLDGNNTERVMAVIRSVVS